MIQGKVFTPDIGRVQSETFGRVQSRERKQYMKYGQQCKLGHERRERWVETEKKKWKKKQERKAVERGPQRPR